MVRIVQGIGAAALLFLVVTATSACEDPFGFLFTFDRELPAPRAAIFGKAVRGDAGGEAAAYAQVAVVGTGLVRQADSEGNLALTDLGAGTYILRIADDDDGDGQPERSRLVATTLVVAEKPEAIGFGGGPQLVSTSLGEVVLEGTGAVSGDILVENLAGDLVPPVDEGLLGRALLFRNVTTESTGAQVLQLGADAETHVDDTGAYRFNEVLAGEGVVVVTLHTAGANVGERGATVFVSEPIAVTIEAADEVAAGTVEVEAVDAALEDGTRVVEVAVTPAFVERGAPYAIFVPAGRPISPCQSTVPSVGQFAYERIVTATAGTIARLNQAPTGVWDVRLCGEVQFIDPATGSIQDEIELGTATIFSLVVAPSDDVTTVLTGPVVLSPLLDPCLRLACEDGAVDCSDDARRLIRDCDGDGSEGIPPYDPADAANVSRWNTCAQQCGTELGFDAAESKCTSEGVEFDCDDDGDLQPDTHERPECVGPGRGDDRDGDGLCSGIDAFPTCTANTPEACEAGIIDLASSPLSIYLGDAPEPDPEPDGEPGVAPGGSFDAEFGAGGTSFTGNTDYNVTPVAIVPRGTEGDSVLWTDDESTPRTITAHPLNADGTFAGPTFSFPNAAGPNAGNEYFFTNVLAASGGGYWLFGAFANADEGTSGNFLCRYTDDGTSIVFDVNFGCRYNAFDAATESPTHWQAATETADGIVLVGAFTGANSRLVTRRYDFLGAEQETVVFPLAPQGPPDALQVRIAGIVVVDVDVTRTIERRTVVMGSAAFEGSAAFTSFVAKHADTAGGDGTVQLLQLDVQDRVEDRTDAVVRIGNNFVQGVGSVTIDSDVGYPMVLEVALNEADFIDQVPEATVFEALEAPALVVESAAAVDQPGNAFTIVAVGHSTPVGSNDSQAMLWAFQSAGADERAVVLDSPSAANPLLEAEAIAPVDVNGEVRLLVTGREARADGFEQTWFGRLAETIYAPSTP